MAKGSNIQVLGITRIEHPVVVNTIGISVGVISCIFLVVLIGVRWDGHQYRVVRVNARTQGRILGRIKNALIGSVWKIELHTADAELHPRTTITAWAGYLFFKLLTLGFGLVVATQDETPVHLHIFSSTLQTPEHRPSARSDPAVFFQPTENRRIGSHTQGRLRVVVSLDRVIILCNTERKVREAGIEPKVHLIRHPLHRRGSIISRVGIGRWSVDGRGCRIIVQAATQHPARGGRKPRGTRGVSVPEYK